MSGTTRDGQLAGDTSAKSVAQMGWPRIVIIGGGFGGIAAARALRKASADIVLVDRRKLALLGSLRLTIVSTEVTTSPVDWALKG